LDKGVSGQGAFEYSKPSGYVAILDQPFGDLPNAIGTARDVYHEQVAGGEIE
jgi:hypothetical protein